MKKNLAFKKHLTFSSVHEDNIAHTRHFQEPLFFFLIVQYSLCTNFA